MKQTLNKFLLKVADFNQLDVNLGSVTTSSCGWHKSMDEEEPQRADPPGHWPCAALPCNEEVEVWFSWILLGVRIKWEPFPTPCSFTCSLIPPKEARITTQVSVLKNLWEMKGRMRGGRGNFCCSHRCLLEIKEGKRQMWQGGRLDQITDTYNGKKTLSTLMIIAS